MRAVTPDMVANSRSRNHCDWIFRIETNTVETPMPTRKRPTKSSPGEGARPKRADPAPAMSIPAVTVARAPRVSASIPTGTCMAM